MTTFTPDPAVWGNYNDPPPNFRPAAANDFWHHFGIYGPGDRSFFRQFVVPGDDRMSSVHLFLHDDDTGWAVVVDQVPTLDRTAHRMWYENRPRFFRFSLCEHEFKSVRSLGRCFTRYRCSRCGMEKDVDSSD